MTKRIDVHYCTPKDPTAREGILFIEDADQYYFEFKFLVALDLFEVIEVIYATCTDTGEQYTFVNCMHSISKGDLKSLNEHRNKWIGPLSH
jgi:hypothetical protein